MNSSHIRLRRDNDAGEIYVLGPEMGGIQITEIDRFTRPVTDTNNVGGAVAYNGRPLWEWKISLPNLDKLEAEALRLFWLETQHEAFEVTLTDGTSYRMRWWETDLDGTRIGPVEWSHPLSLITDHEPYGDPPPETTTPELTTQGTTTPPGTSSPPGTTTSTQAPTTEDRKTTTRPDITTLGPGTTTPPAGTTTPHAPTSQHPSSPADCVVCPTETPSLCWYGAGRFGTLSRIAFNSSSQFVSFQGNLHLGPLYDDLIIPATMVCNRGKWQIILSAADTPEGVGDCPSSIPFTGIVDVLSCSPASVVARIKPDPSCNLSWSFVDIWFYDCVNSYPGDTPDCPCPEPGEKLLTIERNGTRFDMLEETSPIHEFVNVFPVGDAFYEVRIRCENATWFSTVKQTEETLVDPCIGEFSVITTVLSCSPFVARVKAFATQTDPADCPTQELEWIIREKIVCSGPAYAACGNGIVAALSFPGAGYNFFYRSGTLGGCATPNGCGMDITLAEYQAFNAASASGDVLWRCLKCGSTVGQFEVLTQEVVVWRQAPGSFDWDMVWASPEAVNLFPPRWDLTSGILEAPDGTRIYLAYE